jgi:hypothetical protein
VAASLHGIDGWLASVARRRGIPVVQLLHGVLEGPFYTKRRIDADGFLVWGDFWKSLFLPTEQNRISVVAPKGLTRRARAGRRSGRPRVTFFSWPFARIPFYNAAELVSGLAAIFQELLRADHCRLTIRTHPLESPTDFHRYIGEGSASLPKQVRFSQREPLDEILEETDIALMLRSTVMLDCAASGIPIIVLNWLDSDWTEALGDESGVHLAQGFSDLRQALHRWIRRRPVLDTVSLERFIQPPSSAKEAIQTAMDRSRPSPGTTGQQG